MTSTQQRPADSGRPRFAVLGCLLVVLIASAIANRTQRADGAVSVRSLTLPTQNGQWIAADLFKPASATAANPAPLVIVVPGFQRTKETLSNISIELSRRGVVVIAIDPYAQGDSSSSFSRRAATDEGYGMFAVVDYVYDTGNLNYVDKTRIAATGHSAGGNAAIRGASHFGKVAAATGAPSKLHSVYVSGYVLTLTDKVLRHVRSNVGLSYALYDEGAYRNELGHGDMRAAPEARRLVAAALPDRRLPDEVEVGRYYGQAADRSLRVVHNERLLHPFQPYDRQATANQLAFFERVFNLDSDRSTGDQIWQVKEWSTLASLLAAFYMLIPLAELLLRRRVFRRLVHEVPPAPPRPQGRGRAVFWAVFATSGLVACCTYIPLCELSQELFVEASTRRQTWFFPQRMNNAVMLWAVCNGLVGFALFFLAYVVSGRRSGGRAATWGVGTSACELLLSLLLAATLFCAFFGLLAFVRYAFHVDYRFVFLGVRTFRPQLLLLLPMYAPLFFVFFLSNSLRVNGAMRFEGSPEWRSVLLAGLANSVGLMLILAVQYTAFAVTGEVFWTDGWLYVNLLFAIVPIMFALPWFHRAFFQMTGRIYLGPMTTCAVFIMILLSNTVCYLPV